MLQNGCLVVGAEPAGCKPGAAASLVGWPPILWTARVGLLIVLTVTLYLFALATLRFFRRANIRHMYDAPLPRLKEGGVKFAGMEATATLVDSDLSAARQIEALNHRLEAMADYIARLRWPGDES